VATEVEPPELARLLDYSERSRDDDWSLRSALCRFAQPEPQRVSDVLTLVRRLEYALHPHLKAVAAHGPELWRALQDGTASVDGVDPMVVGMLGAMAELDRLGDGLAAWAIDRSHGRPNDEVDAVVADVGRRLDELGVPHEERVPPPGARGRRGV
jgi:hypothetical protein